MNWSIETGILKLKDKISVSERYAFLSAFIVGVLTHGFIFYNKISYLDDSTYYFRLGATYSSGRWGLGVIEEVLNWLGLQSYSMPVANGLFTILFISLVAMLLVRMLNISKPLYAALIGAYMVVFPAVTSTFAYMFTAPYYFFAALLMVVAVLLVRKSWYGFVPAILLIGFGMGIYQANIGIATAVFVLVLICDVKEHTFVENIVKALRCFFSLVLGIVLYFVMNNYFLSATNTQLGDYQGISGMTSMTFGDLLQGVIKAYKLWPHLTRWEIVGISNTDFIRNLYLVTLVLFVVSAGIYLLHVWKQKDMLNTLYCGVLFVLVPLSLGVIHVMTAAPGAYIHTLMIYNLVLIPVYPFVLLQNLKESDARIEKSVRCWVLNIAVVTICVMGVFYFRLDNMAYLKANYQQENAIGYYNNMISQIKAVDNYSDELPVLFLGSVDGQDTSFYSQVQFDEIKLQGYHTNLNNFISYFANSKFIELHCGFRFFPPAEPETFYESAYIKQMPCYPKDGSIEVIDDVVVVKLSNNY